MTVLQEELEWCAITLIIIRWLLRSLLPIQVEDGGVYGIRTREIPDRQSGGVDHWPNTPKWRIGGVPTSRGGFRPPIRFPSEADCQFQHLSKMAELSGFGPPRDLATPTGGLANRCLTRLGLQLLGGRGEF